MGLRTLSELAREHDVLKTTLTARVHRRGIPYQRFGATIAIDPKDVPALIKSGLPDQPLNATPLYRKWQRLRRLSGAKMHRPWYEDYEAFRQDVLRMPNAKEDGTGVIRRVDKTSPAAPGNLLWLKPRA